MRVPSSVRALSVIAIATALVSVIVVGQGAGAKQAPVSGGMLKGPSDWIPLTYEEVQTEAGVHTISYTVYRASDGSVRTEQHEGSMTTIMNRAANRFYRLDQGIWYDHPMRPQAAGGKPFLGLAKNSVVQIQPSDPRVQAVAQIDGSLTFYEHRTGPDNVKIFCPELNLLEVWSQRKQGTIPMELLVTSAQLGEPQVDFAPPKGVTAIVRANPDGPGRLMSTPSGFEFRDGRLIRRQ